MKKIIYLDVDGVINAVPGGKPSKPYKDTFGGWNDWRLIEVKGYPILYSSEMIAALNDLNARPDVEIKWLTTWNQDACYHLSPAIGLDGEEWTVVGEHDHGIWQVNGYPRPWWKIPAILTDRGKNPDAYAVWVDDDHDYYVSFAEKLTLNKNKIVLLTTKAQAGLKKKELASLLETL